MTTKKSKKLKKSKKESTLYYFYSTGCAFCKQIDPIVEKLNKEGHDILRLNVVEPQNLGLANEIRLEYKSECKGTPYLVNVEDGNEICGWYGNMEETIKKWSAGEKIIPTDIQSLPPEFPENNPTDKALDDWKKLYNDWKDENSQLDDLEPVEDIIIRFKKWQKNKEAKQKQQGANKEWLESKLSILEKKLDTLMNHLGVKSE